MTRSEHLKSIARIAERKALKAASVLREQRRRLAQECSRQTQLSSYQDEYQRRHTEVLSQGQNAGCIQKRPALHDAAAGGLGLSPRPSNRGEGGL